MNGHPPTKSEGELIRQARRALQWTQDELAEKLGVSPRTVRSWEVKATVPRNRRQELAQLLQLEELTQGPSRQQFFYLPLDPKPFHGADSVTTVEELARIRRHLVALVADVDALMIRMGNNTGE